jgi:flagellar biosynthesis/type III secretory pathway chaperone
LTTKKGIVVTVLILAAITAASFLVWLIPQNNEDKIIVSDFKTHLDNIKEIHFTLQAEVDQEFQNMLDKKITPKEYIQIAEASSSQVNSQIIQLVESKAPVEWHESYLNYIESLKKFNSQIRETIVIAKSMNENNESGEFQDILEKIDSLRKDSESLSLASDNTRP